MMKVELLHASQCTLGESPMWHSVRKCCYWADIEKGILFEYNWINPQTRIWKFEHRVPLVLKAQGHKLVLALDAKMAKFDPDSGQLEWLVDIEKPSPLIRCNDGSSDSRGRLWIGTMHIQHKSGAGSVYLVDENLQVQKKITGTSISNGIVWSVDNKHLYYVDSPTRVVQSYNFDEYTGNIAFEKNIIEIPVEMGTPDGMAIDEEGMLWIAHWDGFGVYRWNPSNGMLISKIEVPIPQVSSCAFVGNNMDFMIITTARENMKEEELIKYPQSGNTFLVQPGVKGHIITSSVL